VKWVTREGAKVDRIACPWLIKRFVDLNAEFLFVPRDRVLSVAKEGGAIPFDTPGAELNHYEVDGDERCSFDAIIRKYNLKDPALLDMAEIVRTADCAQKNPRPEGTGLESFALGFRAISKDDFDNIRQQFPTYDALYAYCKLKVGNKAKLEHAAVTFLEITERKKVEHQLQERKKELRAFYMISEISQRKDITIEHLYQDVANFLPESWQYPEITCARIVIGKREFRTINFKDSAWMQSAPIRVFETIVGDVEVAYLEEKVELDEGPFMKEERLLINAIAELIGHITERKLIEEHIK